jgi:hypothetical protein
MAEGLRFVAVREFARVTPDSLDPDVARRDQPEQAVQ